MNLKNAWNAIRQSVSGQPQLVKMDQPDDSKIETAMSENSQCKNENAQIIESLNKQVELLEARNAKLSVLKTSTKPKEDPKNDADWNISNNRRAYMDDMWSICERT
jgi:hypothetical protein